MHTLLFWPNLLWEKQLAKIGRTEKPTPQKQGTGHSWNPRLSNEAGYPPSKPVKASQSSRSTLTEPDLLPPSQVGWDSDKRRETPPPFIFNRGAVVTHCARALQRTHRTRHHSSARHLKTHVKLHVGLIPIVSFWEEKIDEEVRPMVLRCLLLFDKRQGDKATRHFNLPLQCAERELEASQSTILRRLRHCAPILCTSLAGTLDRG